MTGFREMVARDIGKTFLNLDEYGEIRSIRYDGDEYSIPVVISGIKEKDRTVTSSDHAQGLYLVSATMHCSLTDMHGVQPEKGQRIRISEADGSEFYRDYYIAKSDCEMGMLRIELEEIDE